MKSLTHPIVRKNYGFSKTSRAKETRKLLPPGSRAHPKRCVKGSFLHQVTILSTFGPRTHSLHGLSEDQSWESFPRMKIKESLEEMHSLTTCHAYPLCCYHQNFILWSISTETRRVVQAKYKNIKQNLERTSCFRRLIGKRQILDRGTVWKGSVILPWFDPAIEHQLT